ncbi:MAG: hypothetical protein VX447_19385 [Pseudomonadota bacterium]|nr:hypothetical protein [Pseudomonadota bacterium]
MAKSTECNAGPLLAKARGNACAQSKAAEAAPSEAQFLQEVLHQLRDAQQPLKWRYRLLGKLRRLKGPVQP